MPMVMTSSKLHNNKDSCYLHYLFIARSTGIVAQRDASAKMLHSGIARRVDTIHIDSYSRTFCYNKKYEYKIKVSKTEIKYLLTVVTRIIKLCLESFQLRKV